MDCTEAAELIHDALDGRLDVRFQNAVNRHVDGCPDCAAERSELERLKELFAAMPAVKAPEGFRDDVMANLPAGRVVPFRRAVAAAAAVAAAVVIAVWAATPGEQREAETAAAAADADVAQDLGALKLEADAEDVDLLKAKATGKLARTAEKAKKGLDDFADGLGDKRARAPDRRVPRSRAKPDEGVGGFARSRAEEMADGEEADGDDADGDDADGDAGDAPAPEKKASGPSRETAAAGGRPVPPPKPAGAPESPTAKKPALAETSKRRGASDTTGEPEAESAALAETDGKEAPPTRYLVFADAAEARTFVAELQAANAQDAARWKAPADSEERARRKAADAKDTATKGRAYRKTQAGDEHEILETFEWKRAAEELDPLLEHASRSGRAALVERKAATALRLRPRQDDEPAGGGGGAKKKSRRPASDDGPSTGGGGAAPGAGAAAPARPADQRSPTVRVIILIRAETAHETAR